MTSHQALLIAFVWSISFSTEATLIKPRLYEVRNINSTCTSQTMKVRIDLNRNFQGVVYAKGFPLEKTCRSLGTGETFVEISIDTSGCGVRLVSTDNENFTFRVSLNIQMDKFLQQITDLEVSATCDLSFVDMVYSRHATYIWQQSRTGRNKVQGVEGEKAEDTIRKIKTWMEIEGTSSTDNINKVAVGEQTMVVIKTFLPENIAANVIDCYAYDGTREVAQKLLDENGCPLDEAIMPSLEIITYDDDFSDSNEITWEAGTDSSETKSNRKLKMENKKRKSKQKKDPKGESKTLTVTSLEKKSRLQIIGTIFSAFKFPDTSNLHLKCTLQICRKICPTVSCDSNEEEAISNRKGKALKSNRNTTTIIDKIEVFNSVEVVAPGIDSDGYSSSQDGINSKLPNKGNAFCLSASKMAFSFAILGAVFLCGVLAALWTVMRKQMRKANKIDGSDQILVVRDSPMNFMHSRSKMYNWTYS